MKVKELKKLLEHIDDEADVMVRNSHNVCGNICDLSQLEKSQYGFFGSLVDCVVLNSGVNCLEDETEDEVYPLIETEPTKERKIIRVIVGEVE